MSPPIFLLPNELIFVIVQLLGIEDAFSMAQSCRRFNGVVRNNGVCRALLEKFAPFSREYRAARDPNSAFSYTRAWHALVKSRRAVTTLQPFVAAVVACDVDVHVYANRTLLYMAGRDLRILDLGRSVVVRREMVIDVPAMLAASLPESKGCVRYKFRPLHYAAGYVTCLYTHQRPHAAREQWLLVFNATGFTTRLQVAAPHNKVFVRNNTHYLIVGTLTGRPEDNAANGDEGDNGRRSSYHAGRYWVLRRFSFHSGSWSDHKIYLDAIGCAEFGTDVAFELFDEPGNDGGTLYALALQTRRATWSRRYAYGLESPMSYYCCVRMPLRYPGRHQQAARVSRRRRRNDEGPLDDRFCSLSVERDEATGALTVVERRKEWLKCNEYGGSGHNSYKQELDFEEGDKAQTSVDETSDELNGMVSIVAEVDEDMPDADNTMDERDDGGRDNHRDDVYTRLPENVHPGDSTAEMAMFSFSDTAAHLYITSCAAFVDLVNLPDPETPLKQRMVLRASSRRPHPPSVRVGRAQPNGIDNDNDDVNDDPLYPLGAIRRQFQTSGVVTWPPDVDARDSDSGGVRREMATQGGTRRDYSALHEILNPPGYAGHVSAKWEDYTLVCATGGDGDNTASQPGLVDRPTAKKKRKQALVLVSFDPTLCLPELTRWDDRLAANTANAAGAASAATAVADPRCVESLQTPADKKDVILQPSWVSFDEPAYRREANGFDFSC